jgi:hypothetical protein
MEVALGEAEAKGCSAGDVAEASKKVVTPFS